MKRFSWILLLVAACPTLLPASSKKLTVGELQDLLAELHSSRKSDDQVANELKQIELTEELTPAAMNAMVGLIDGPLSTEQMYVLEARSAMLAPPEIDLPKAAPLDAAAQRALLAKAQDYATKTYSQLPRLTATRLVARFQNPVEAVQSYAGIRNKIDDGNDPIWEQNSRYARLANTHTDTIEIDNGIEKAGVKDTASWGRNGLVNSMLPFTPLNLLTDETVSSGKPRFLRWETIAGHRTAVFAFAVAKKRSHYAIDYCCFPETSSIGGVLFGGRGPVGSPTASLIPTGGNLSASPYSHPTSDSISYKADWNPFKAKSGYHGELFLDPDSGTVLRTIVEAEFKSSDFVHYEDIRVDYAPNPIGGKSLYVPVRSFTNAEVVPNGDSVVKHFAVRQQFVIQVYKDFRTADGSYQGNTLLAQGGNAPGLQPGKVPGPQVEESEVSFALSSVENDDPEPAGGFPALDTISRPEDPLDITASANPQPRPSDEDVKALLDKAAQSANDYWDSLPNFTCLQVTERFVGSSRKNDWEHLDTITGRLDYFDHQEEWVFKEYEKDHKISHDSNSNPGLGVSNFGIFGDVIRGLFRPSAKPEISWFETDALSNGTVQVFKYRVAKENSNLHLRASSADVITVGFHGMVYLDSATGAVRRITQVADDVPKKYPIPEALVSTDYDYASIGNQQYLLPIGAQIVLREQIHKNKLELNRIRFSDFHRFRSTVKILGETPASPQ